MKNRQCPICPTGYLAEDSDMYGDFVHCLMCGWNSDGRRRNQEAMPNLLEYRLCRKTNSAGTGTPKNLPVSMSWSGVILTARRFPRPHHCIWSCCRTHPDKGDHCCAVSSSPYPYCQSHKTAYRKEFGTDPPCWKEMALRVPYGPVQVEYLVETKGPARNREHALAQRVLLPSGDFTLSPILKRKLLIKFRRDTGLTLMWLDDALDVTRQQGLVPAP